MFCFLFRELFAFFRADTSDYFRGARARADDRRRTETARGGTRHRAVRYPAGLRDGRDNGPVGCDTGARRRLGLCRRTYCRVGRHIGSSEHNRAEDRRKSGRTASARDADCDVCRNEAVRAHRSLSPSNKSRDSHSASA